MNNNEKIGYEFANGVFYSISKFIIIGFLLSLCVNAIRDMFDIGTDDSDLCGDVRSGLKVHKDAKTGIEYLSDGHGGLVRREYR